MRFILLPFDRLVGFMPRGAALILTLALAGGCKSLLDPSELHRGEVSTEQQQDPLTVRILEDLEPGMEEPNPEFLAAEDVRPEDLDASIADYRIGPNDTVSVSITDIAGPGTEGTYTRQISDTGNITLPLLPEPVKAEGLSEAELQRDILEAYRQADVLRQSTISVSVGERRGRTFSIRGAIGSPGRYQIPETDFRLLNAIVAAGDLRADGVENIYVIRRATEQDQTASDEPTAAPASDDPLTPASAPPSDAPAATGPARANEPNTVGDGFRFNPAPGTQRQRVIRVPFADLDNGELRYNIVIRPNDLIVVPIPRVGVYYMGGHVQSPGAYRITPGVRVTLMDAVIAARMLDGIAIPSRTDVIRRNGQDRYTFVRVDLDKIFSGQQSDLYLKPNDKVVVGTNAVAPFLAAARNAFRVTYGFGFLYDRNYAHNSN